tara:strand:+ start:127599 stop:128288 length:690 start_codon:yes stop_codon:yes gene_type:complete
MSEVPTIVLDRSHPSLDDDTLKQVDLAWSTLCVSNPRYFNGGMLAFDSFDPSTNTVHAHTAEYKLHAVRDTVDLGVSLLAVTGVFAAHHNGHTRYMLGKRSPTTHRYGNQFEFGPCGGIDVPDEPTLALGPDAIISELRREAMEEAGIELTDTKPVPIAIVHDDHVGSVDIVLKVTLDSIPATDANWEYAECVWLTLDELQAQIQDTPNAFIPTAIVIANILRERADYD